MKKTLLPAIFFFVVILSSCGPAAEDREQMHARAKIFQDSIANVIRAAMAEAAAQPQPQAPAPATVGPAAMTATPANSPAK